jgi:hypothetical protein
MTWIDAVAAEIYRIQPLGARSEKYVQAIPHRR